MAGAVVAADRVRRAGRARRARRGRERASTPPRPARRTLDVFDEHAFEQRAGASRSGSGSSSRTRTPLVSDFLRAAHEGARAARCASSTGRVELGVTAYYVEEAVLAEIVRESRRIARLREADADAAGGSDLRRQDPSSESSSRPSCEARRPARRPAILERLAPLADGVQIADEPIEQPGPASVVPRRAQAGARLRRGDERRSQRRRTARHRTSSTSGPSHRTASCAGPDGPPDRPADAAARAGRGTIWIAEQLVDQAERELGRRRRRCAGMLAEAERDFERGALSHEEYEVHRGRAPRAARADPRAEAPGRSHMTSSQRENAQHKRAQARKPAANAVGGREQASDSNGAEASRPTAVEAGREGRCRQRRGRRARRRGHARSASVGRPSADEEEQPQEPEDDRGRARRTTSRRARRILPRTARTSRERRNSRSPRASRNSRSSSSSRTEPRHAGVRRQQPTSGETEQRAAQPGRLARRGRRGRGTAREQLEELLGKEPESVSGAGEHAATAGLVTLEVRRGARGSRSRPTCSRRTSSSSTTTSNLRRYARRSGATAVRRPTGEAPREQPRASSAPPATAPGPASRAARGRARARPRQGHRDRRRHPDQPARHRAADGEAPAADRLRRQGEGDGHRLVAERSVPLGPANGDALEEPTQAARAEGRHRGRQLGATSERRPESASADGAVRLRGRPGRRRAELSARASNRATSARDRTASLAAIVEPRPARGVRRRAARRNARATATGSKRTARAHEAGARAGARHRRRSCPFRFGTRLRDRG